MKKQIFTSLFAFLLISFIHLPNSQLYGQLDCCCDIPCGCIPLLPFPDCNTACQFAVGGPCFFIDGPWPTGCLGSAVCNPLPISLESFQVIFGRGNNLILSWQTLSEQNNEGFEIQRASGENMKWTLLAFIPAKGNTYEPQEYSFKDENPLPGLSYYRLKQKDFDGSFSFSDIETINLRPKKSVTIWPTLAKDYVFIKIDEEPISESFVEVYNLMNRKVLESRINAPSEALNITNLPKGQYIVTILSGKEFHTMQFVKIQ